MASLRQFSRRITIRGRQLPSKINNIVKKTALAIDQVAVITTPVDTGFARSNWIAAIGTSPVRTIEPYAPGNRLGLNESSNAQGALNQARIAITARRPEGGDVYIVNNTPYIETLNNGSSAQAPKNFVELAVQAGIQAVRRTTGREII